MLILMFIARGSAVKASVAPVNLQINYMSPPVFGVDRLHGIHFSWQLPQAREINARQFATQVIVNMTDAAGVSLRTVYDSSQAEP